MQVCVAFSSPQLHLSSLWPFEVSGTRDKATGRSRSWGSLSARKARRNEGEGSVLISSRWPNPRLGFVRNGILGSNELRKWTADCVSSSSAAAERDEEVRVHASLMVDPAVWIVRTAVFYILLETGIAAPGRSRSSAGEDLTGKGQTSRKNWTLSLCFMSDLGDKRSEDKGPLAWIGERFGGDPEEKRNKELAKLRRKWHASTKGILVRRYRVPSKAGGRKLLNAISSLLADDDTFRDVSTHKGCQIRRENAHAESVCCHNVRALFDELPTPHLVVEITVFPPGPITTAHYEKADKIERVLRTGASI